MSEFQNKSNHSGAASQKCENGACKEEKQELELDALEEVNGGISLRDLPKQKTTDIDDNTRSKL